MNGQRLCGRFIRRLVVSNNFHHPCSSSSFSTSYQTAPPTDEQYLKQCYQVLNLPSESSGPELKSAYLKLVRQYHPDTARNGEEDTEKFQRVQAAYKFIVENEFTKDSTERMNLETVPKIFDIRHTAPQHRQYLEYDGIGSGTPFERQKQFQQHRASKAVENVREFTVNKIMQNDEDKDIQLAATPDNAEYSRRWKVRNAMERLVEDLILESMQKGEFENFSGAGKPLKYSSYNPHLDTMTQKLNEILLHSGYSPEWIVAEKEIRKRRSDLRKTIGQILVDFRDELATNAWTMDAQRNYECRREKVEEEVTKINKDINRFNLIVPTIHKQMFHLCPLREFRKVKSSFPSSSDDNGHFGQQQSDN